MSVASKLLSSGSSGAWSIDNLTLSGSFNLSGGPSYNTSQTATVFNPNGLQFWVIYDQNVYEYATAVPWDFSVGSYVGSTSISADDVRGTSSISYDGHHLYVPNQFYNGSSFVTEIYQYYLSTAFDFSTLSFVRNGISCYGCVIKPGGDKIFVLSGANLQEYSMSTPYDISTASLTNTDGVGTQAAFSRMYIKPDGSRFYFSGLGTTGNNDLRDFTLSPAWTGNASLVTQNDLGGRYREPYFTPDGKKLFLGVGSSFSIYDVG